MKCYKKVQLGPQNSMNGQDMCMVRLNPMWTPWSAAVMCVPAVKDWFGPQTRERNESGQEKSQIKKSSIVKLTVTKVQQKITALQGPILESKFSKLGVQTKNSGLEKL